MRNRHTQHPGEDQLLRYLDGELRAAEAANVRGHLEACWDCRAAKEEMERTISACVRYRKRVLQEHLPEAPAQWADLESRFTAIDVNFRAMPGPNQSWGVSRWAMAAAAAILVSVLIYRMRETPAVQAAELLRKAVAAADAAPAVPHRLRIRTKDSTMTRAAVRGLFVAAKYSWNDPLSARSYQAWRNQLSGFRDAVDQEPGAYRVRTTSDSGDLREASLQIRSADYRPVQGRFDFRDGDWVEISEVEGSDELGSVGAPATIHSAPSVTGPVTAPELPAAQPAPAATLSDELRVYTLLHRLGADLGDPIEVARNGSEVVVSGLGLGLARQQELRAALGGESRVVLQFSDTGPVPNERLARPSPAGNGAADSAMQSRVAEQFGGRAQFEQIAGQVLDLSDGMVSRAYALRRLAETFPEGELRGQDLVALAAIRRDHIQALSLSTVQMSALLKPMFAGMPSVGGARMSTEELFQCVRRVDKLVGVLFGSSTAGEDTPSQLNANLGQLRAALDSYRMQ